MFFVPSCLLCGSLFTTCVGGSSQCLSFLWVLFYPVFRGIFIFRGRNLGMSATLHCSGGPYPLSLRFIGGRKRWLRSSLAAKKKDRVETSAHFATQTCLEIWEANWADLCESFLEMFHIPVILISPQPLEVLKKKVRNVFARRNKKLKQKTRLANPESKEDDFIGIDNSQNFSDPY